MRPSTIVAGYLLVQAIGILAWWGLLIASPGSIKWFQPADWPPGALRAFWLADGLLLVGGSLVAATGVFLGKRWASGAVWAVALVSWYPTLVCLATSLHTGEAWIATALMVSMAGIVQGLAVDWLLGSIPVILYALLGGVLWHAVVRPVEERDLAERFGEAYRTYQSQVGLWMPKMKR